MGVDIRPRPSSSRRILTQGWMRSLVCVIGISVGMPVSGSARL